MTYAEEFPLRDYQVMGIKWLQANPQAALLMEAGHGKTRCVLEALTDAHLPALIVGPPKVAQTVWDAERDLWRPDLPVVKATGGPEQRLKAFKSNEAHEGITTISWSSLRDAVHKRGRPAWKTVVYDELSMARSPDSARFKNGKYFNDYRGNVEHRWGLTGTPSPNSLLDLWAQARILDDGKVLGRNFPAFRNRYFQPDGTAWVNGKEVVTSYRISDGSEEAIWKLVEPLMLSIFGRLKLPPRHDDVVKFLMSPKAVKIYNEMRKELATDLDDLGLGDGAFTTPNAATLSSRLSQISAGFLLPDPTEPNEPEWFDTSRIEVCYDIIDKATSPILVFYRFKEEARVLLEKYPKAQRLTADNVASWNRGEIPVYVTHPASAAHGLNLQHGGHTALWTSPTWEPELWVQGNARLLRQGQRYPVVIHVVCADGTIDTQKIMPRLEGRVAGQDRLMDALGSPI